MLEKDIPDLNIFMVCDSVNRKAFSQLPPKYKFRTCRENELDIWMGFPFDDEKAKIQYRSFMIEYFETTYAKRKELFFKKCLFVVDEKDRPVATCFIWKAYGKIPSIHWFKTIKNAEGQGIGRALLTEVMKNENEYPIILHTQPSSFRAIKLYSDFGFKIATNKKVGMRKNQYQEALPILKEFMKPEAYKNLQFGEIKKEYIDLLSKEKTNQF